MSLELPTVADVRVIITTTLTDDQITDQITLAEALASQCSGVSNASTTIQAAIVKYITAHFIAMISGGGGVVQSETLGDASKSYAVAQPSSGAGLNASRYGQQAVMLDTTGCLAKLGKPGIKFKVL